MMKNLLIAYRRWRTPWWRRNRIICDPEGFSVASVVDPSAAGSQFRWADIQKVEAFKRELLEIDLICLTFSAGKKSIEVNEKMGGWNEFLREFEKALPGMVPEAEWFPPGVGTKALFGRM